MGRSRRVAESRIGLALQDKCGMRERAIGNLWNPLSKK
jgi:hypothetical protein